jgi:hypothetical protein
LPRLQPQLRRTGESCFRHRLPDLPGCFSAGDTLEQAIAGVEEAGLAESRPRSTSAIESRRLRRLPLPAIRRKLE